MGSEHTERVLFRTSPEWLAQLDNWRREQPDIPSRSEAIRRLVLQALDAAKPKNDS